VTGNQTSVRIEAFVGVRFHIKVATVTTDRLGRPTVEHYSVVREMQPINRATQQHSNLNNLDNLEPSNLLNRKHTNTPTQQPSNTTTQQHTNTELKGEAMEQSEKESPKPPDPVTNCPTHGWNYPCPECATMTEYGRPLKF
jgi:hypothetical protein